VYLLVFNAYINEMHGSRRKIPSKNSRQAALRRGVYSGVKELVGWQLSMWICCKLFFLLLYNCQLLCFW
jgi:hypothetical protein